MNLKEKLMFIRENEYQSPPDPFAIVQEMLKNIGTVDAQLRDELIYTTLSHWIPSHALTTYELEHILTVILDDQHLLYQLGESHSDSVFTRSFSILVIPLLLMRHRDTPFLSSERIHQIKDVVFHNVREERDYRGYDETKGWAHAIAHAADALDDLAQCNELNADDLSTILDLVYEKMTITERVYSDGEDERMVSPVMRILERNILSLTYIQQWIQRFGAEENTEFLAGFRQKNNMKNFLKSLYFRLKHTGIHEATLCSTIEQTLYKIEPVYYSS